MSGKNLLLRPLRSYALAGLCVTPIITAASLVHTHGIRSALDTTILQVTDLRRKEQMGAHFETRYEALTENAESYLNPRVFWTDSLRNTFGGSSATELAFSIADPSVLAVEFTGRVSNVLASEYLLQLSANLDGDTELIHLLSQLQAVDQKMIRNRSCNIKRQETSSSLKMDCIYSIIDLARGETNP